MMGDAPPYLDEILVPEGSMSCAVLDASQQASVLAFYDHGREVVRLQRDGALVHNGAIVDQADDAAMAAAMRDAVATMLAMSRAAWAN